MNKYCFQFVLVLIAIGGSVSALQAQDFVLKDLKGETDARVVFNNPAVTSPPPAHDAIQPQPSPDTLAFSEVQMNIGDVFNARSAAFQNAFGINAVFAEVSEYFPELPQGFAAEAQTLYDVEIQSTRDLAGQTIPFEFVINSGQLRIDDFARFEPDFLGSGGASVAASIRLFGLGEWEFAARLTKDSNGDLIVTDDVSFTVGPFGAIVPFGNSDDFFGFVKHPALTINIVDADGDGLVDDAVVDISKITGVIPIDGAEFDGLIGQKFTYKMAAQFEMVDSNGMNTTGLAGITDPFALGTPNDPSDNLGGPFSPLGVEFFLDGQSLSNFPAVPEPSTAAMLALAGLAVMMRRGR